MIYIFNLNKYDVIVSINEMMKLDQLPLLVKYLKIYEFWKFSLTEIFYHKLQLIHEIKHIYMKIIVEKKITKERCKWVIKTPPSHPTKC